MTCEMLALAGFRCGDRGQVEHAQQLSQGVEERRRGTAQVEVAGIEVVLAVAGQRAALGHTGADAVGAGVELVPVGADHQPVPQRRVRVAAAQEV